MSTLLLQTSKIIFNTLTWRPQSSIVQKGVGIWAWASNDQGEEPDVVMAACGDVPTMESLAATALLRQFLPEFEGSFCQRGRLV